VTRRSARCCKHKPGFPGGSGPATEKKRRRGGGARSLHSEINRCIMRHLLSDSIGNPPVIVTAGRPMTSERLNEPNRARGETNAVHYEILSLTDESETRWCFCNQPAAEIWSSSGNTARTRRQHRPQAREHTSTRQDSTDAPTAACDMPTLGPAGQLVVGSK